MNVKKIGYISVRYLLSVLLGLPLSILPFGESSSQKNSIYLAPQSSIQAISKVTLARSYLRELHSARDKGINQAFLKFLTSKLIVLFEQAKEQGLNTSRSLLEELAWWASRYPDPDRNELLITMLVEILSMQKQRFEGKDKGGLLHAISTQTADPDFWEKLIELKRKIKTKQDLDLETFSQYNHSNQKLPELGSLKKFNIWKGDEIQKQTREKKGGRPLNPKQLRALERERAKKIKTSQEPIKGIIENRSYYRHFFGRADDLILFNSDEIADRVVQMARAVPAVTNALKVLSKKEPQAGKKRKKSRSKGKSWHTSEAEGKYAQYVENDQIVGIYGQGSFLWGMGSAASEGKEETVRIPPGDMDFIVIVEDSEILFDIFETVELKMTDFIPKEELDKIRSRSIKKMDIVVISTGYLKDRFEKMTPRIDKGNPSAKSNFTVAGLLINLWGSSVILKGRDLAEEWHPGYKNLLTASHNLYQDSTKRLSNGEFRKAVNRMLESILLTEEAVLFWNQQHPRRPLKSIFPADKELESLFDALQEALDRQDEPSRIEIEAELGSFHKKYQKHIDEWQFKLTFYNQLSETFFSQEDEETVLEDDIMNLPDRRYEESLMDIAI